MSHRGVAALWWSSGEALVFKRGSNVSVAALGYMLLRGLVEMLVLGVFCGAALPRPPQ